MLKANDLIPVKGVSLKPYCTLRAGGEAELFIRTSNLDEVAEVSRRAQEEHMLMTMLGSGSNILPSDHGVPGLVLYNGARRITFEDGGMVIAETGCALQELFLKCSQQSLGGLEFAVGIPGTLGGALVSNAGAYRSNISTYLIELEVVVDGERKWVAPDFMQFAYRDSILRRPMPPTCAVLRVRMQLPPRIRQEIYRDSKEYQRQRISKQPPMASAGSFFKNINDPFLAERLPNLPEKLRSAAVVPAGFLIQEAGFAGLRHEGAMFSRKHANFIVNVGAATSTAIRQLAELAKEKVYTKFGVRMEEEVLYLGDWQRYKPAGK